MPTLSPKFIVITELGLRRRCAGPRVSSPVTRMQYWSLIRDREQSYRYRSSLIIFAAILTMKRISFGSLEEVDLHKMLRLFIKHLKSP